MQQSEGWQVCDSHPAPPKLCPGGAGLSGGKLQLTRVLLGGGGTSCWDGVLLGWRDRAGFASLPPEPWCIHQAVPALRCSSAPTCPAPWGDAHPAGEVAVEAELVLDGIGEPVHDPLTGSSGGVLQRRHPTVSAQGWGGHPVMQESIQPAPCS